MVSAYHNAFYIIRLDNKKKRYILSFKAASDKQVWKADIESRIEFYLQTETKDLKAKDQEMKLQEQVTQERKLRAARLKEKLTSCEDIAAAAYHGDVAKLKQFIQEGADVNMFDDECLTPMMNAALKGHLECVQVP